MTKTPQLWEYERVINKAKEVQKLAGNRTIKITREPTDIEVVKANVGHEPLMIVRHKKGDPE